MMRLPVELFCRHPVLWFCADVSMFICIHAFGDIAFDMFSIVYPVFEKWCGIAYQWCVTFSNV